MELLKVINPVTKDKAVDYSGWDKVIAELNGAPKKIQGDSGLAHAECKEKHVCLG